MVGPALAVWTALASAPPADGSPAPRHATVHPAVAERLATAADRVPVWVFFEDKGPIDVGAALRDLERDYNARALRRRALRRTAPGLVDRRDLPVHEPYRRAVAAAGAQLRTASRWLNAVSADAGAGQIEAIARLPFVCRIEPVRRLRVAMPPPPGSLPRSFESGDPYGLSQNQLAQINLTTLHLTGFTGDGVLIGVLDTGFVTTHEAFNHPQHPLVVAAEHDFVNDDPETGPEPGDPPGQPDHGTYILGTMGAYKPRTMLGAAYDAAFILAKVEDVAGEYAAEEDLFAAGLEFIESNGGDVATSSVVIFNAYEQSELDGCTAVMTEAVNVAADNGVHCCQGAGNEGHDFDPTTSHLLPPADGFRVIACGAVDATGASAGFTSDGPSADGRVKPEVLARGVGTATVSPTDDAGYLAVSGTSLSTPLTAGAVACLVQAHPEWTVDQMRYALTRTADFFAVHETFDPFFVRGYGIVDAVAAAAAEPPPPGDLDGDGAIGTPDFLALLAAWGPCPGTCPPDCPGDLDGDGGVGVTDLLVLLANWS